VGSNATAQW